MKAIILILVTVFVISCGDKKEIEFLSENTFVHNKKVYKLIENELVELGDLTSDSISKLKGQKPERKKFNNIDMSFIKQGVVIKIDGLFIGNILYYKLNITGIPELRNDYTRGVITLYFENNDGFYLHTIEIPSTDFVGLSDGNNEIVSYEYKSKTEINPLVKSMIKSVSASSSIRSRNRND